MRIVHIKMLLGKHLILLTVLGSTIQAWPMVRIQFINVTHNLLMTHYGDMNTSVSTAGGMNAYFNFTKDADIFVRIIVNFESNNLRVNFMNKTVSWCKVIEAPRYEPLIKIAYKIFSRKSHLPQKCPIEKNHLFYIQNFIIETDELPPILPNETNITVTAEFLDKVKNDLLMFGTVKMTGQAKHY